MIAALTLIFSIMTSYARARAESLVEKCKVGFMERPEADRAADDRHDHQPHGRRCCG